MRAVALSHPAHTPFTDRMSAGALDHASARRGDADFIANRLSDSTSLFVPLSRGRVLIGEAGGATPAAAFLCAETAQNLRQAGCPWAFLGLLGERAVFVVDLGESEPGVLLSPAPGAFTELRPAIALLPASDVEILGYARGLMHWRGRHLFCGVCGGATAPEQAGHALRCTKCGAVHFPRTDPAVIMLVTRDDEAGVPHVLLGHSPRFPSPRLYTILAGFVEPGENVEQAVKREVAEETGVEVRDVRYFGSQTWPFPGSIMLGFTAAALGAKVTIDPTELADARWFPKSAIRDPAAFSIELPNPVTIARQMLEAWAA